MIRILISAVICHFKFHFCLPNKSHAWDVLFSTSNFVNDKDGGMTQTKTQRTKKKRLFFFPLQK